MLTQVDVYVCHQEEETTGTKLKHFITTAADTDTLHTVALYVDPSPQSQASQEGRRGQYL